MLNKFSKEQKEQVKKYAIFALMFIIFGGCMWLLFAPSEDDLAKEQLGYNTEIPEPKGDGIISDKQDAYEQEMMQLKKSERMQNLQDIALLSNSTNDADNLSLLGETKTSAPNSRRQNTIQSSTYAYQDMNRTLGSFYEKPKEDPEKEELKQKLEELEAKMNEKDDKQNAMDEQLAFMEKSYELAAKYMPQGQAGGNPFEQQNTGLSAEEMKNKIGKNVIKWSS